MIRCEGLVHVYPDGTRALNGVDLEIGAGERVALTGPNGSGKTTLVRHWNGLLRPTSGNVTIDGRSTADRHVAELARSVGMTFQDPTTQLFGSTCRAEVGFGLRAFGIGGRHLDEAVGESLSMVGLADHANTNPYDLGPSKRRLLAIACVLAVAPAVMVFDEPTIGLDTNEVERFAQVLVGESERGRTVVAITHDPRLLGRGAFGREVRMEAGRIVAP